MAQPIAGITVKETEMHESNGRVTHIVWLARDGDKSPLDWHQYYSSTIQGRAQYEAAALRHFLGQGPEPDLLAFDTE